MFIELCKEIGSLTEIDFLTIDILHMTEEAQNDYILNKKIKKETVESRGIPFGVELLVAKIDKNEFSKKYRTYPWRDLGTFIASKETKNNMKLCDIGSSRILEMLFQVQAWHLFNALEAQNLIVLDYLPNIDSGEFTPVSVERFLELATFGCQKDPCVYTRSILSLQLIVSNIVPGMTLYIMLRPFMFSQKNSDRPYYAGSLLLRTAQNSRGWFHQFKWRFSSPADTSK